jgi:hypothetical protein
LTVTALWTVLRRRALQSRFPNATIIDGYKSPLLDTAVAAFEKHEPSRIRDRMPWMFAILLDSSGFGLWSSSKAERPILFERWDRVGSVTISEIERERSRDHALILEVPCGNDKTEIPFVVMGRGIFALSAEKPGHLSEIARSIEQFKIQAVSRAS